MASAYLLFTFVLVVFSVLSFVFINSRFSTGFVLHLGFLSLPVLLELLILLTAYVFFDTLRFYYILKSLKIDIPFLYVLKLTFINTFVSTVTPFATGGGFAQIYFLKKKNVPIGNAAAASTIRTALAFILLFAAIPIVLIRNDTMHNFLSVDKSIIYAALITLVYALIAYMLYQSIRNKKRVKMYIYKTIMLMKTRRIISRARARKLYKSISSGIDSFLSGISAFAFGGGKHIFLSIVATLLFLFSLFLFPIVLVNAMGYRVPVLPVIETQVLVTAITYFAPTPGAAGIAEGGFAFMFSETINNTDIAPLTLSWRLFSVYISVAVGFVLFYAEVFSVKRADRRRMPRPKS